MLARSIFFVSAVAWLAAAAHAQAPEPAPRELGWKSTGAVTPASAANLVPLKPAGATQISKGSGTLPNDHGQIWREYDITPYTARVTSTTRPEQAIVDWILRETGYEAWHSEPLGILSANKRTLRVYHTPEVHATVADIVDRFVSTEAETQAFGLRIVTIANPNWRARALRLMTPVPVQSQGIQGWLMAKEDAAMLIAELGKRNDFREHSSPHMLVHNGQSTVISTMRPRSYIRGVLLKDGAWPGYEPEMGQIDEGFSLEFSPLQSSDGRTIDAIIKLRLSQVEKMLPVMLEVPTSVALGQHARIEVPQMSMSNLHERFRWPTDRVLLLSAGVVATPAPGSGGNVLTQVLPLPKGPDRADALLFVECKGKIAPVSGSTPTASGSYPGRY